MVVLGQSCSACGSQGGRVLFDEAAIPVHVCVLWPDAASARGCPRGAIQLALCERCGLIENRLFDADLLAYGATYENSLGFSELFQGYLRELAADIVERHDARGKRLIEIGCGDGEFLGLLCALGDNRGVGFDPSYSPTLPDVSADGRVEFVRDYYSERYAEVPAAYKRRLGTSKVSGTLRGVLGASYKILGLLAWYDLGPGRERR